MPAPKPKPPTEHVEQVAFVNWCRMSRYPYDRIYAIPNGGMRNVVVAAKLKAEGVKAGIPDLCLPYAKHGFHGLHIEMKRIGEKVKPAQLKVMQELIEEGYACVVCQGAVQAKQAIQDYVNGVNLEQFKKIGVQP